MRFGEKYLKKMQCEGSYRMDMWSLGRYQSITNCWKHATTTKDANSVSEVAEYDESNTHDIQQSELEQIWITAKKKTSLPDDVNLEDYLGADNNVSTCYELTEPSQSDVPDFIFTNIHQLQNYLLSIKTANLLQKKIVDYL